MDNNNVISDNCLTNNNMAISDESTKKELKIDLLSFENLSDEEYNQLIVNSINQGLKDMKEGRVYSHEEINNFFNDYMDRKI